MREAQIHTHHISEGGGVRVRVRVYMCTYVYAHVCVSLVCIID